MSKQIKRSIAVIRMDGTQTHRRFTRRQLSKRLSFTLGKEKAYEMTKNIWGNNLENVTLRETKTPHSGPSWYTVDSGVV